MKKRVSGLVLTVLLVFCFVLAGCGSKSKNDDAKAVIGTWNLVSASEATSGVEVTKDQLETFGLNGFSFEFKEDGTLTFTPTAGAEVLEGTYTVKGDEATIKVDGSTIIGKITDNQMTMEEDGTSIVLEKQQ